MANWTAEPDQSVATNEPTEFRVGDVFKRTCSVFARNFLKFGMVSGIAALPCLLIPGSSVPQSSNLVADLHLPPVVLVLIPALSVFFGQAIVVFGTFQDIRGRPTSLSDGLKVSLRRFFALVGLAFCIGLLLTAFGPMAMALFSKPDSIQSSVKYPEAIDWPQRFDLSK